MANTSLAQQLHRLATPQTSILLTKKKRASLLFDPKDASNLDLETVLEIGLSGLRELEEIGGSEFSSFEESLFDLTSVGVERAVLNKKTNDLLDEKIDRFLCLLSPYVLLKPAHRALEWLIQRFHINEYNRDSLIFLFLPYHETKIFVRAIQLIDVSRKADHWHWLDTVHQSGAPISRNAVINQAATNNAFISGLCNHVLHAIKVHKSEAGILSSMFAFYCTTLVGAIEGVKKKRKGTLQGAKEAQLQVILPCLLKGLSSTIPDFASASFIVVSSLARNGYLGLTLLHKIINKVIKNCNCESLLLKEIATLLAVICETQSSAIVSIFPSSALKKLLKKGVAILLIRQLASIAQDIYIEKVSMALLVGILPLTKASVESIDEELAPVAQKTLDELTSTIFLGKDSAKEAIRLLVSALAELMKEEKENEDLCDPRYSGWLNGILQSMENKYPSAFDVVIQKMALCKVGDKDTTMTSVLGRLLGLLTFNHEDYGSLMEKLCHSEEGVRVAAIRTLADTDIELLKQKKEDLHSLVWVMGQRLQDDSPDVVMATLALPYLVTLIGKVAMTNELINLLGRATEKVSRKLNRKKWFEVILLSVKILLDYGHEKETEEEESKDTAKLLAQRVKILLTVLPFLCPASEEEVSLAEKVLNLNCSDPLMEELWKELSGVSDALHLRSSVFEHLVKLPSLAEERGIHILDLTEAVMAFGAEQPGNPVVQLMTLITLSGMASCSTTNIKATILKFSIDVFENAKTVLASAVDKNVTSYKISAKSLGSCLNSAKKGYLPLQALLHSFSAVFQSTETPWFPLTLSKDSAWWSLHSLGKEKMADQRMQLAVQIFDILISGCFSKHVDAQHLYVSCIKDFFEAHLPDLQHQLNFLSCLWVAHEVPVNVPELNEFIEVERKEMLKNEMKVCQQIASTCKIAVMPELQVRSLCLGEALVSKSSSPISWLLEPDGVGAAIIPSLLIACSSPINCVRAAALKLLNSVMSTMGAHLMTTGGLYVPLVRELLAQSEEILSDSGQLSLFLYAQLSTDPDILALHSEEKKKQMAKIREALFAILDPKSPAPRHVVRALLQVLNGVRSLDLVKKLSPLGMALLEEGQLKTVLDEYASDSLVFIINRLDDSVAAFIGDLKEDHSIIWTFFQKALTDTHTKLPLTNDGRQFVSMMDGTCVDEICPSILAVQQVTKEFFDTLPSDVHRMKVLSLLVDVAAQKNVEDSLVAVKKLPLTEAASMAAKSAMKRLTLNADLIVEELSKMLISEEKETVPKAKSLMKRVLPIMSMKTLQSQPWTRGVTLLEIIQNKKKLRNAQRVLPVLFQILQGCLQLQHQEPVEYTKQLILACALHCLRKVAISDRSNECDEDEHGKIDEHHFDVETIVQCIRSTQNPHTHRHALLLLSCAAELIPDSVLHNVMAIFAFVGTSMVRQDDEYSFEVISRTIESIIPVLVKVGPRMQEKRVIQKLPEGLENLEGPSVEGTLKVMRVFADAVPDVPPHRRLPLYLKLVETVGWNTGLPQLLLLVIEGQVLHSGAKVKEIDRSSGSRVELACEMARRSPPYALIQCCLRMVQYVKLLPADKESGVNGKLLWHSGQKNECLFTSYDFLHIFDVKKHTGLQLRHFKHAVLSFLSDILSEPVIAAKLSNMDDKSPEEELNNQPADKLFQCLIQELLGYIAYIARELEESAFANSSARYWKAIQQRCHQILEKVNTLLPPPLFLSVVKGLLSHQLPSIRRKAADILNARLVVLLNEGDDTLSEEDRVSLEGILLGPLMDMVEIVEGMGDQAENTVTKDSNINCQVALLTAKLLIRILGPSEKPNTLKPMLVLATKVASASIKMEEGSIHFFGGVLASAALCIAEICSVLKVKVLEELHHFMPVLLSALSSNVMDNVTTSAVKLGVVTAVQRVVESIPHFLSPYLRPLLVRLCLLASKHINADAAESSKESKSDPVSLRLSSMLNKVALAIPLRVLIPSVSDSFKILSKGKIESLNSLPSSKCRKRKSQVVSQKEEEERESSVVGLEGVVCESESLAAIVPLMEMFSHSLSEMSHEELTHHLQELELFFLHALELRVGREDMEEDDVIEKVEASVIHALVTLVLKLSEASFRPLYYRLFEWTSQEGAPSPRAITFYRLSSKFAEALKGLFVLFAGNFIRHAATLLDQNNLAKINEIGQEEEERSKENSQSVAKKSLFFGEKDSNGSKSHILIKHILLTLHAVFLYDGTGHFVTRGRFETLMLPLVNQLENLVGGYALFKERCLTNLVPTLVQLAVASADDSLWKQLNYQILLKTRHSNPQVRLAGLSALLELGKRLGEDFLPLLPETVPFLAELMEDEEEEVESATQSALNVLSDVLGEPLQKYF